MTVDGRMRAQVGLVLDNLEGSAVCPPLDEWDQIDDFDYLYREYAILTREQDADRVELAVTRILREAGYGNAPEGQEHEVRRERVSAGVVRLMVPRTPLLVPAILDQLDEDLGPGIGTPDHVVYVCPYVCPIPEAVPVPPGTQPVPPPAGSTGQGSTGQDVSGHDMTEQDMRARPETGHEGEGVSVVVVDTGLIEDAAAGHPWLDGVRGADEYTYAKLDGEDVIAPYSGHGTFVAGVARCIAPRATVYVERAFAVVGADYETSLLHSLERALDRNPDILAFPFTTSTRGDLPPLTFDDLFERRTRNMNGLVMLAAAGNDTMQRPMWPATYREEVISVGALAASGRERAFFSNYGEWVDVYARGQDLINAFPVGTYVYTEPPKRGTSADFDGMAMWGGTSFAVPIVAGLIAARMSVTGENARQAADSLLQAARDQAIRGVGAVLHPGQALLGYRRD
jgi:subtilisin family serine protease